MHCDTEPEEYESYVVHCAPGNEVGHADDVKDEHWNVQRLSRHSQLPKSPEPQPLVPAAVQFTAHAELYHMQCGSAVHDAELTVELHDA